MKERTDTDSRCSIAVVGMFDGVHTGHRYLLDQLAREGENRSLDPLIITFSNHPLELIAPGHAPRLLTSSEDKVHLLNRAIPAGKVILLPFDDTLRNTSSARFLAYLRDNHNVKALLLGFNNRFGHDAPRDFGEYSRIGQNTGIEILHATEYDGVSSSTIRRALESGDVTAAAEMLGRPYSISGHVGTGRRIGRTIGFPTANIVPDDSRRLIPANGVYACRAICSYGEWPAMVNIGCRPTIGEGLETSIEAHIIGLPTDTDLYDSHITIEFVTRLRSEQHFNSLDELAEHLNSDRDATLRVLDTRDAR